MKLAILALALAAGVVFSQEPSALKQLVGIAREQATVPPPTVSAKPVRVPDDLSAAKARIGNAAQGEKLAARNRQPKSTFRIDVIGDAEPGRFAWERVFSPGEHAYERLMAMIGQDDPDLVFQLGDMVSKGTEANYRQRVKYLEGRAGAPVFSVIGNHDRSAPNGRATKALYEAVFGSGDFVVDYNGWLLVGLDTADRTLRDDQMAWLKRVLIPGRRAIVFTHVPPKFLKGTLNACAVPETAPKKGGYVHDVLTAYFDENAQAFDDLMAERHVERVYFGHIHAFGMAEHRGTRYVLSGGGGSPLYPLPVTEPQCLFAHYIRVTLSPGKIRETVRTLDGREFDLP